MKSVREIVKPLVARGLVRRENESEVVRLLVDWVASAHKDSWNTALKAADGVAEPFQSGVADQHGDTFCFARHNTAKAIRAEIKRLRIKRK